MTFRQAAARLSTLIVSAAMLVAPLSAMSVASAKPSITSAPTASTWQPRPEQYPGTAKQTDLVIPMSDGTMLRGDLSLPAGANGTAVEGRFPIVVTITAYNKSVIGSAGASLAGADPSYLIKRGYGQLTVDARGTGNSEGTWAAFSERENKDAAEVIEWAHSADRPWSSGDVAMTGASYMGISQIFAAAHQPAGLKAIFPQVPAADVYRDVVASGGQVDVGFIPLWLGLVTTTGLIPPAYGATDPQSAFKSLTDHLIGAGTFTAPLLINAVAGQDPSFDGPFYAERSPINVVSNVNVPTFFIGGEYDLFQRGTPLLFENLRDRGVPTKFILGPWDHLQGSSGAEVGKAGHGSLAELQLRWFDKWLLEANDPTLDTDIPAMTYYEQGSDSWKSATDWITDDLSATSFKLSGRSMLGTAGTLTTGEETVTSGTSTILPLPVSGLCTRSANQWTAGIMNVLPITNPCLEDNRLNDTTGAVFETAPVTTPVHIRGPINAHLYASSLTGDGMLSVSVSSVAPDGKVSRLTGGWQVISHRALDETRTRRMDGKIIQPFHPFTKEAKKAATPGEIVPVDVEVFPTGAVIAAGHKLRMSVQAFDVPHLLPPLTDVLGALSPITLHNSAVHPAELTVPTIGAALAPPAPAAAKVDDTATEAAPATTKEPAARPDWITSIFQVLRQWPLNR